MYVCNVTLLPLSTRSLQDGRRSCETTGSSTSLCVGIVGTPVVIVAVTLAPLAESPLAPGC